jgi:hypothetical protein
MSFHDYNRQHLYNVTTDRFIAPVVSLRESSFLGFFKKWYVEDFEMYECSGKHRKYMGVFSFLEYEPCNKRVKFETEEEARNHINERLKNEKHLRWRNLVSHYQG